MNLGTMKLQAQELIEQVYQKGYKAGYDKAFATLNENWRLVTSEAEEKGRNEAWEVARKMYQYQCCPNKQLCEILYDMNFYELICNVSASEAIEKLRVYQEQNRQEEDIEIHVGDEVLMNTYKVIVLKTSVDGYKDRYLVLFPDGSTGLRDKSDFEKTGRTFPEIAEVLKKMKEKDERIEVGDEVIPIYGTSEPFIAITVDNGEIYGLDKNGAYRGASKKETPFKKTGRHFSEIREVLKKLQEENNE